MLKKHHVNGKEKIHMTPYIKNFRKHYRKIEKELLHPELLPASSGAEKTDVTEQIPPPDRLFQRIMRTPDAIPRKKGERGE